MLKGRSSTGETPRRKKLELEEEFNRVTQLRRNLTGELIQSALPNQSRDDPEEHIKEETYQPKEGSPNTIQREETKTWEAREKKLGRHN